jgi:hypothetical protein
MVFILYKIYNSDIKFIGAYENEEDALNNKNNLSADTSFENYIYNIVDIPYLKYTKQEPMRFSEEDNNIDEEDYYELQSIVKYQSEEIITLKKRYTDFIKNLQDILFRFYVILTFVMCIFLAYNLIQTINTH